VYSGVSIDPGGSEHYYTIGPKVELSTYDVVRETPCGYWIRSGNSGAFIHGPERWVSKATRKRFALPSQKEAMESFLRRKSKQISIISHQLDRAKRAHELGSEMMVKLVEQE
jgi:hypothetical protein